MPKSFIIAIIDDGFLGKYVEKELERRFDDDVAKIVKLPLPSYDSGIACDVLIDTSGAVKNFPSGCPVTVSVGAMPSENAAMRFVLPVVIGTGMKGSALDMARSINRGTYYHVKGDDDRRAHVIHAVDVARAIGLAVAVDCRAGTYFLTDGRNPLVSEIAEGLAHRLGQKRIYTLSPKWFRFMNKMGLAKKIEFSPMEMCRPAMPLLSDAVDGWNPVDTVEYLKTHDYGNDDF